jgi:hypothetical protein
MLIKVIEKENAGFASASIVSKRGGFLTHRLVSLALLLGLCLTGSQPAAAYGVLTHHQLIDEAWASGIVPLLLSRYPSPSPEQLREAHAFAYGGCLIQDFGYYPFANGFIAGLTHYVRSGDFVQSLFRNAQNANELAFAIGALSHFIGDGIGHSEATNPSVALVFPKLRARSAMIFGPKTCTCVPFGAVSKTDPIDGLRSTFGPHPGENGLLLSFETR